MSEGVVQRRGVPQAEAVADRFGQGRLGAPTELPATIFPVAKVARVDIPMMGTATVVAVAANRSMVQLFNPVGSNTDLLVKRIWAACASVNTLGLFTHDTALLTLSPLSGSMVRQEGSNQVAPIGQVRSVAAAAVGSQIGAFTLIADTPDTFEFYTGDGDQFDGFVIQPGRGILMAPSGDNITLRTTYEWLERQTG